MVGFTKQIKAVVSLSSNAYAIVFKKTWFPFNKKVKYTAAGSLGEVLDQLQGGNHTPKGFHLHNVQLAGLSEQGKLQRFAKWLVKFIRDLLKEKGQWSLARICFIIILGFALRATLVDGGDIPAGFINLIGVIMTYIFLGKTPLNTLIDSNNDGVPDLQATNMVAESDVPVTLKGTP